MRVFRPDENTWLSIAKQCQYATFFHTPFWHQLAAETYPWYEDCTIGFEMKDGTKVILPLLEARMSDATQRRDLISTFAFCYGDAIAPRELSSEEHVAIYNTILESNVDQFIVVTNPLTIGSFVLEGFIGHDDFTQLLYLDPLFDRIFAKFSKGHKSSTTKGRRLGVKTRVADTIKDYQDYFGAYQSSLKRWSDKRLIEYPWTLFENGYLLAKAYPCNLKLWIAEFKGELIAGAWIFYWNNHVVYWHGAAYEEFFCFSPVNVLLADVIQDACERHFSYFDFNPSGGLEGVAAFKRRFGATKKPVRFWLRKGWQFS